MYNCHPNANALILSESYFIYKLRPAPSCDSRYCGTDWILWSKKNWKLSFYKSICRCWYREAIKVVHSVLQTLLLLLLPDFKSLYQGWIKNFYYRNCGVIQGFPPLRKAVTTYVKKYRIFLRVMIKAISYWHVTRLWHHSAKLMNERQSSQDSQYKLFVGTFSNYGG